MKRTIDVVGAIETAKLIPEDDTRSKCRRNEAWELIALARLKAGELDEARSIAMQYIQDFSQPRYDIIRALDQEYADAAVLMLESNDVAGAKATAMLMFNSVAKAEVLLQIVKHQLLLE